MAVPASTCSETRPAGHLTPSTGTGGMVLRPDPTPADRHVMANQTLLPTADTVERYLAIRGDHARLRPGVTALCDRLTAAG